MKSLTKWIFATVAAVLMVGSAQAIDAIAAGTVKSIDADKKTFVLTDSANKDHMFKLGENLLVNRAGEESKGGLKVGDAINVCYEDNNTPWVSHYILVQQGDFKGCELVRGKVKGYDADKKELSFVNDAKEVSSYPMGEAKVRQNREDAKIENIAIGEGALLIVHSANGKSKLMSIMADRARSQK